MGGDASRNGAELFETEADFSAKIVTFRLVGGMHPPHPPLNPPLAVTTHNPLQNRKLMGEGSKKFRGGVAEKTDGSAFGDINRFLLLKHH